jgi:hypothetical protein
VKCFCPDPGPETPAHCALLQDFPGGFYGDMEAGEYYSDAFLWCQCPCHIYDDYGDDDMEEGGADAIAGEP